jgi:hypothetical protein
MHLLLYGAGGFLALYFLYKWYKHIIEKENKTLKANIQTAQARANLKQAKREREAAEVNLKARKMNNKADKINSKLPLDTIPDIPENYEKEYIPDTFQSISDTYKSTAKKENA